MTLTLPRVRSPRRSLTVEEKETLLNLLARAVGVLEGPGVKHGWPYPEVTADDDTDVRMPLTEDGAAVVATIKRKLAEYGREPIPLVKLGS